jgi:ankyrin repeat protein
MVRTKIHELVIAGEDEDLAEYLMEDPANKKLINEPDAIGWTPLHWACSKGHNKEVKILLANNADPNVATEADGWTAAHDAARKGNSEALREIQLAGGNIERASSSGTRPLHYAVQYGQAKAVDWMLKEGCDVDGANATGWSPLHFAARYGRKDICSMLLAQGAMPTAVDKMGRSCGAVAAWVRDCIKEGKGPSMKLDETVKADAMEEMMGILAEAADRQAEEAAKMAKLAMENYKSSYASADLHGAYDHLAVARDQYIKARDAEEAKRCDRMLEDLRKEMSPPKKSAGV